MTTRPFGTDPSALAEGDEPTGSSATSDTSGGIDWESDDNPYKKRVSGLDTSNETLRKELEEARDVRGLIDDVRSELGAMGTRVTASEEMSAEALDGIETASRQARDLAGGEAPDNESAPNRAARVRLANATQSRKEKIDALAIEFNDLYREGMANDPAVRSIVSRYNAVNQTVDGSRDIEFAGLLSEMRTVATRFDEASGSKGSDSSGDNNDSNARSAGAGDDGGDSGDDGDGDGDGDSKGDDKSALEKNRGSAAAQGVTATGSTVGTDSSNMTPRQKLEAHDRGETPTGA